MVDCFLVCFTILYCELILGGTLSVGGSGDLGVSLPKEYHQYGPFLIQLS